MAKNSYENFLATKKLRAESSGFRPKNIPDWLFPFQKHLLEWGLRKGSAAIFSDCGTGKGPMGIVAADNITRHTNKPVMIFAPLAVSAQFVREGEKFGYEVHRSRDGKIKKGINTTNYEQISKFSPDDFGGVIVDESSCLKGTDSRNRKVITDFLQKVPYKILCTATPAPNDFMELGTSSEALGVMPRVQMLGMFFTNDGESTQQWRLKGHARSRFWEWVGTWAKAVRRPSDLGEEFDDTGYVLPKLNVFQHKILTDPGDGFFARTIRTLDDWRAERKRSLRERCEKVASLVPKNRPMVAWCHLNDEGDLLEELIPDSVQVSGKDSDEAKEEKFMAFSDGQVKRLITKPKIGGFGLNWQHCADVFWFPSYSFESYYQALRRCYRFGQRNEVNANLVYSEPEKPVLESMLRKERSMAQMYDGIVRQINQYQGGVESNGYHKTMEIPKWLR